MSRADDRLAAIACLLARTEGIVSGEELARQAGVSRAAVRKHIQRLIEAGAEIEAVPGAGYRMIRLPGRPDRAGIAAHRGRVGAEVRWECEMTSTNDVAVGLARAGMPEGTVVTADIQTAGRGRRGRVWRSPAGGFYLSVILRPPLTPAGLTGLGLLVALAFARALDALGIEGSVMKWPNDVLIGGRKVAGVLVEAAADAERVTWAVAGVGANVGRVPPATPEAGCVDVPSRAALGAAFLDALEPLVGALYAGRGAELVEEAAARCETLGARVRVTTADGVVREGVATGLEPDGSLALVTDAGEELRLTSGDVERLRSGGGSRRSRTL